MRCDFCSFGVENAVSAVVFLLNECGQIVRIAADKTSPAQPPPRGRGQRTIGAYAPRSRADDAARTSPETLYLVQPGLFCCKSLPLPSFLQYAKDAATSRIPSEAPKVSFGSNNGLYRITSSNTGSFSTTDLPHRAPLPPGSSGHVKKAGENAVTGEYVNLFQHGMFFWKL